MAIGRCLLFDNDCCNWSCASEPSDPIQESIGRHIERYISDPSVCQKMSGLLSMVGLKPQEMKIDEVIDAVLTLHQLSVTKDEKVICPKEY